MTQEIIQIGNELTIIEQTILKEKETIIRRGLQGLIDAGFALADIRDARLFRDRFGTFEEYCAVRWNITSTRAKQLIDAAMVAKNISTIVSTNISEGQLRPLTKLQPDEQREVYQIAVDTAPNGIVTAAHVQATVNEYIAPAAQSNGYHRPVDNAYEQLADDLAGDEDGYDWTENDNEYGPIVFGELGNYRQKGDTKRCEKCYSLWIADLDYCPYCHLSPEVRSHYAANENMSKATAYNNHAISDTPGYDGDEWYTPSEYVEAARCVMGSIDLDPATCQSAQSQIGAKNFYTKEDDSLRDDCEWTGNVWLNPPYSMPLIRDFVFKLIAQFEAGNIQAAIIVTNNCSDTGWFHELLSRFPACFTRGRIQFWRPDHERFGTRQGQTFFYLGDNEQKFTQEFSKFGKVVKAL